METIGIMFLASSLFLACSCHMHGFAFILKLLSWEFEAFGGFRARSRS